MKTKNWVKVIVVILCGWNITLSYLYYKEHKAQKIAERTLFNHFEPELEDNEKSNTTREAEATREQLYK